MTSLLPRVVLVTRETELAALLARHATRGQVEFYLSSRGQDFAEVERRDHIQTAAIAAAKQAVPADWSFAQVSREDLNRFLFTPNDIVVALGQDGLVANIAKYLDGQPVIGVAPDPDMAEGILTPHPLTALPDLLQRTHVHDVDMEHRTMASAELAGGDSLLALNELFIGHRSHQSARYEISFAGETEFQSSSGVIVSTGTGLTGWAKSIMAATHADYQLAVDEARAAFFTREPWPSRNSGCSLRSGIVDQAHTLAILSRINDGGVIFADGIEQDFLRFDWGSQLTVAIGTQRLCLVRN